MESSSDLNRSIGLLGLISYGVGDILGSGVYGMMGKAAGHMGNLAWLAFSISMALAFITGFSYASLGSVFPKAGSSSLYVTEAFHKDFLAYMVGMLTLGAGLTSMAAASHIFSGYLVSLLNISWQTGVAVIFLVALALLVLWGVKESIRFNYLFTLVEVVGLLIIIGLGFSSWGEVDLLSAVSPENPSGEWKISWILTGTVLTFFAFIGFEDMLSMAEEIKEPKKTIPVAVFVSIAVTSVLYIAMSVTMVSVLSPQALAESKQPLVDVVLKISPRFPEKIYSVISMFAVANTALLNFLMASRLLYGMSKQAILPEYLSQLRGKKKNPTLSILTVLGLVLILTLTAEITTLARATSILVLIPFLFVHLSLLILKRKENLEFPFKIPGILPVVGAITCLALIFSAKSEELQLALIVIVAASLLFAAAKIYKKQKSGGKT